MYDKAFTLDDIRALGLCKDPTEVQGVEEGWTGTAQDILSAEHVPPEDQLRVVLQLSIPHRIKLEFAWGAASQVQHLMRDERSTRALDVLRAYLDGNATADELKQAGARAAEAARAAMAARATAATWAEVEATRAAHAAARAAAWVTAAYSATEDTAWLTAAWAAWASLEDMRRPQILHLLTLLNTYTAKQQAD